MLKTINVILVALMLGGAGFVYLMKYDSERAAGRIAKLQHDIVEKRQQITTLHAEWSLLNQPRRIQDLVEKYRSYLELDTLDPTQVASIDDIPFRPTGKTDATAPDPAKPASRMLAIGKPTDLTGSLAKKTTDGHRTTERTDPLASPKTIDPNPNDPINALIR
jgi:hypothetical protein